MTGSLKPRILLWNSRNMVCNLSELKILLYEKLPQAVGICETCLQPSITPKFASYTMVRKDREPGLCGRGITFLIRNDVKYCLLPLHQYQGGNLEVLGVKVAFQEGWGHFLLCYNPCKNVTKDEFSLYFQQIPSP